MRQIAVLLLTLGLLGPTALAGPKGHKLVDRWQDLDFKRREFQKLIVVGISDDREIRRNFENKFVSHLRGKGVQGITSHSLVPDLTNIENEHQIIDSIEEQRVDGAISVRVVRLDGLDEKAWGEAWKAAMGPEDKLRTLIEESLPVEQKKARKYGVEVALWDTRTRSRVWAARTNTYTRKQLKKGGGEFVQFVMAALKNAELL